MTNLTAGNFSNNSVEIIPKEEVDSFEFLTKWINSYTGLHFPHSKQVSLYRRLNSLCMKIGYLNLNELVIHIRMNDNPDLPAEIVRTISTNHSFFFRETEVLDYFQNKIITSLPSSYFKLVNDCLYFAKYDDHKLYLIAFLLVYVRYWFH